MVWPNLLNLSKSIQPHSFSTYIFHQSIILIIFEEEKLIRTHPTVKFHFKKFLKTMINYRFTQLFSTELHIETTLVTEIFRHEWVNGITEWFSKVLPWERIFAGAIREKSYVLTSSQ